MDNSAAMWLSYKTVLIEVAQQCVVMHFTSSAMMKLYKVIATMIPFMNAETLQIIHCTKHKVHLKKSEEKITRSEGQPGISLNY